MCLRQWIIYKYVYCADRFYAALWGYLSDNILYTLWGWFQKNGNVWEPTQRDKGSCDCSGPTRWGITSRILDKENSSASWKRSWGGWDIQSLSSSLFSEVPKFAAYLIFPRIWSLFSPNAFWPSQGIHKRIRVLFIMCGWRMKSRMFFCMTSAYKILHLKNIAFF